MSKPNVPSSAISENFQPDLRRELLTGLSPSRESNNPARRKDRIFGRMLERSHDELDTLQSKTLSRVRDEVYEYQFTLSAQPEQMKLLSRLRNHPGIDRAFKELEQESDSTSLVICPIQKNIRNNPVVRDCCR